MAETADIIPMTVAARRANKSLALFKSFCERNRLLIDNGGGKKRKRFDVSWSEYQNALYDRDRVGFGRAAKRSAKSRQEKTCADVYC